MKKLNAAVCLALFAWWATPALAAPAKDGATAVMAADKAASAADAKDKKETPKKKEKKGGC